MAIFVLIMTIYNSGINIEIHISVYMLFIVFLINFANLNFFDHTIKLKINLCEI